MNIQPNTNNLSFYGKTSPKGNGYWECLKNRVKQTVLDALPSATFEEKNNLKKWKKIDERISRPAENRLIMGASAIVTQPFIDLNNKRVDEETRQISCNRTIAKIIVGTGVGILIRGSCYELVQKMTNVKSVKKYSKSLIPKEYLIELTNNLNFLNNYRSALSTSLAIMVMSITNFVIDAPLTVLLTNKLNARNKSLTFNKKEGLNG